MSSGGEGGWRKRFGRRRAPPAKRRGSALESSSSTDQPAVRIGRLGRPHGLDGFLGLYVELEDLGYFEPGSHVLVEGRECIVRSLRRGKQGYQVMFEEAVTREQAEALRGSSVFATQRRLLGDDEFWPSDLVGLEVRPGGGVVVGVSHGSAQDRLVIERDGRRFEVPFVDELVPVVDPAGGFVEITEIEWLSSPPDRE
ncbi:MAG TPA: ribosome maturation factor RimM [Acidimicrobiia bacterium]|nr:ribosome maturation factor RimM [Acidimicrobiia bacterium]